MNFSTICIVSLLFITLYFIHNYTIEEVEEYKHEIKPIEGNSNKLPLPPLKIIKNKKFYSQIRDIRRRKKSNIYVPIGEEIINLNKIGSLLVVGPTGCGKSILVTNIICSIIMNYSSNDIKLALIDTSTVEFEKYKDLDFVIKKEQDIDLIKRMEREVFIRRQLFKTHKVNHIEEYNKKGNQMSSILLIIDDLYDFQDIDLSHIINNTVGIYVILVSDFDNNNFNIPKIQFTGIGKLKYKDKEYNSIELDKEEIENIVNYYKDL